MIALPSFTTEPRPMGPHRWNADVTWFVDDARVSWFELTGDRDATRYDHGRPATKWWGCDWAAEFRSGDG